MTGTDSVVVDASVEITESDSGGLGSNSTVGRWFCTQEKIYGGYSP